jgi:hypothetical protein
MLLFTRGEGDDGEGQIRLQPCLGSAALSHIRWSRDGDVWRSAAHDWPCSKGCGHVRAPFLLGKHQLNDSSFVNHHMSDDDMSL